MRNLNQHKESSGVTGSTNVITSWKGTFSLLFQSNDDNLVVDIVIVPRVETNIHNGFSLLQFYDCGFKESMCVTLNKVILKVYGWFKHKLPVANKQNRLDCIEPSIVKPYAHVLSSLNMVQVKNTLSDRKIPAHIS